MNANEAIPTTKYTIGQAVITEHGRLVFITGETRSTFITKGAWETHTSITKSYNKKSFQRLADIDDIIIEAKKMGWRYNGRDLDSPSGDVYLRLNGGFWVIAHVSNTKDYFGFGKECLQAAHFALALNLAP